jgi:hypothetical protein|tara:strand:- start:51 stop:338 length:288 start_codon:yes stop_codon:yes gene_type:complete
MTKKQIKKSDHQYCIVDHRQYFFYEITWIDPTGNSGWSDFNELSKMSCSKVITRAFIFKKTKDFIWTFSSYDNCESTFSDTNVIPTGVVKEIKKL